jgi:hypothetical protein
MNNGRLRNRRDSDGRDQHLRAVVRAGPLLLLLHYVSQKHLMRRGVAPVLARKFTKDHLRRSTPGC